MYVYVHTCVCIYIYICICIHTHVCIYTCVCICIIVYIYIYIHICIYIYIYICVPRRPPGAGTRGSFERRPWRGPGSGTGDIRRDASAKTAKQRVASRREHTDVYFNVEKQKELATCCGLLRRRLPRHVRASAARAAGRGRPSGR